MTNAPTDIASPPPAPAPVPPPAPANDKLAVRFQDGTVGRLPREEAVAAVTAGHAEPATAQEFDEAHAKYLSDHATAGQVFGATAMGAIRGLGDAAGLPTDKLAIDTSRFLGGEKEAEITRRALKEGDEMAPIGSKVGEFAGMALPALFGDEAVLGRVGEMAEGAGKDLAAKLIPEATEGASNAFLPRSLQNAIPLAARGAAEGAQLAAVDAVNEDSIENHPLTGEQLFAASLKGAAGGAIGAGILGTADEGFSTAAKSLREAMGSSSRGVMGNVNVGLSGHLANEAEERGMRALFHSSNKKAQRQLEALPGGGRAAARRFLDDGIYAPGDTVTELAPKVAQKREELGAKIGEILDNADEAGVAGPSAKAIVDQIRSKILPDFETTPSLYSSEINKVNDIIGDINALSSPLKAMGARGEGGEATLGFRQAQKLRGLVDNKIKDFAPSPGAPANSMQDMLKHVRGILEDHIESAMDRAEPKLGRDVLQDYKSTKLAFRQYATADSALEDAATSLDANRGLGPTSYASGVAMVAHSGLQGAVMAGIHHVIRERGNATAAVVLDKLAKMNAVKRQSANVADEVTTGLQKFFAGKMEASAVPRLDAKRIDAIAQHLADPQAQRTELAGRLGDLPNHAPKVAQQVALTQMRAVTYMTSKLPRPLPASNIAQPQLEKKRYAPEAAQTFARVHQVVSDPTVVPKLLGSGQLTRDHVEALQAVYPAMYDDFKKLVAQKLTLTSKKTTFSQRVALSLLLGTPLDATMDPKFIADIQATYAEHPETATDEAPAPKRPLKLSGAMMATNADPESAHIGGR